GALAGRLRSPDAGERPGAEETARLLEAVIAVAAPAPERREAIRSSPST
ncbi:hypothetical protein G3I46_28750, partial [Streptomyces coelicoflavus]|nr:hypothetical protein [Streptomyces coelicoflavus]